MIDLEDLFPGFVEYDLSTRVDENAVLGILRSGPNEPSASIVLDTFRYEVARLFEDTYKANATTRLNSADRARLRVAVGYIETYVSLAREFRHTDFPPPLPPRDWVQHVKIWQASIDDAYPSGTTGGRPAADWISTFYPRALALYLVIFETEATGSINELEGTSAPAVQFVQMLLEEMLTIDFGHPYEMQASSPLIGDRKLSAVSKRIAEVLAGELEGDVSQETDYRLWCRLYQSGQEHRLTRKLT